jgi:predicted SprT family Zn-dependent metalloprotease
MTTVSDLTALFASDSVTVATVTSVPEPEGVRELAELLMRQHGLDGWTLLFDTSRTRAGQCRYGPREISLSAPLLSLWTRGQQLETILHEIAHALTYLTTGDRGHGPSWQLTCVRIGAQPTRCWGDDGEERIEGKYTGTCPNGHVLRRHKLTRNARRFSCSQCSLTFTWTVNGQPA